MALDYIDEVVKTVIRQFEESGFPEENKSFEIIETMVVMRDGVHLETIIYLPENNLKSFPTILQRTCYPHNDRIYRTYGENLAKRGFAFVYQYCRGNSKSEGVWVPNINEKDDGIDTVEWLYSQEFVENIGYWGCSYTALAGWAFADKVTSMCLEHYGTDRFVSAYEKGSFRQDVLTSWTMENAGFKIDTDYIESCKFMPQINVDEKLWGGRIGWYRDYISNSNETDAYWNQGFWKELKNKPGEAKIPLYIISGWYDHHHGSTMKTWERLSDKAKKMSWLEIGGWNHFFMNAMAPDIPLTNFNNNEMKKMLCWFDLTLKKKKTPCQNIKYYIMGKDEWLNFGSMDEIKTKEKEIYFELLENGDKKLSESMPEKEYSISYIYNPEYPVETLGGDGLLKSAFEKGGMRRQPEKDFRSDVISFESDVFKEEHIVIGKIRVELWVGSDAQSTAFTAKIMSVNTENEAYNIRTSITSIEGKEITKAVIDFWDIAFCFKKGSKIRIDISSSDFPQFNIHSNHTGNWALQDKIKVVKQQIFMGGEYGSKLILPVVN